MNMAKYAGVAWTCPFCLEIIVQPIGEDGDIEALRRNFKMQADAHIDFETDLLAEEIATEVGGGQEPR